jgi:ectoine hydroxylase-related dioxygenase (phytanoyl-CoA dioxygenase family)
MGYKEYIELMIAIDAQTPENGCLELVPGSHKTQVALANGGRIDPAWESSNEFIQVPLNPGVFILDSRSAISYKIC